MARKKKRRSIAKTLQVIILWLAFSAILVWCVVSFFTQPAQVFYPAFGIDLPGAYQIHGIDVSRYQETINWKEVKHMEVDGIKIGFAFIKATEGIGRVDPQFRRNWLKCEEQKIPRGAYHFFVPGRSGKKQARNFIQIVNLKKGDLPPVIDIEKTGRASKSEIKKEFSECLRSIEAHYGVRPIIYTNIDYYNNYLRENFGEYPIWIAHYLQPLKPRLDEEWIFWQHSENGRVNGISSPVDFNVFSGDSAQFKSFLLR